MNELEELREYEKKKKSQQSKAQSKFTKIGANFKNDEASKIKEYCSKMEISISEFVKELVYAKFKAKPQAPQNTNTTDIHTTHLNKTISDLKSELKQYTDKTPQQQIIDGFKAFFTKS